MAQGDVKVAMSSIAASSLWTIQPSAGGSWLIDRVGSGEAVGGVPDVSIHLYDGSNSTYLGGSLSAPEEAAVLLSHPLQMYINNSVYLQLRNNFTGGSRWLTYSGIQTK